MIDSKMPVDVSRLIRALAEICEEKELKAAASESLKGGFVTGTTAVLGGLIFGPLGLALGGAIGGAIAATTSYGKFKPVPEILMELPHQKKQLLYEKIQRAFSNFGVDDVINLTMLIMSTAHFKEIALKEVVNFLVKDMNLSIQS